MRVSQHTHYEYNTILFKMSFSVAKAKSKVNTGEIEKRKKTSNYFRN